jgi:DNA polymerase (family 10)
LPIYNRDVAGIFEEIADLLEIDGANAFRVRAYREAARTIHQLPGSLVDKVEAGDDLTKLDGIGEDLAGKIQEIVETGELEQLKALHRRVPPDLADLMNIPGLGAKRVKLLHEALGVTNRSELAEAARQGRVREVDGFGEKTEENIRDYLEHAPEQEGEGRVRLAAAEPVAASLVDYLEAHEATGQVQVAGSFRRRKETVGDLDVLVTAAAREGVIDYFTEYEDITDVRSQGETRATVMLRGDIQVDLRVVSPESYGAALLYFTGSKAHNLRLRNMAVDNGLKINEYGVFEDGKNGERIAGEAEAGIYAVFDLPYIVPELREDRGEIETAKAGELPNLVKLEDIRGDLQSHTAGSDGRNSLEEMAQAAQSRGYQYLAITDHSPRVGITQGQDADTLAEQIDEIDRLNEQFDDFRLLKSAEVDILKDGSLDLPDDILDRLDLGVCAVHTNFKLSREEQTERILRAMDNPYFNILAHPTGRMIGKRPPYDVDVERIIEAARERGCFLEVNADPRRLDLDDRYVKLAKEMGLKLAISTDAHSTGALDNMHFGVGQARRGWLETDDALNTRDWSALKELFSQ